MIFDAQKMVLADALAGHDGVEFVELRQTGNSDVLDLLDEAEHPGPPLGVEAVPVLIIMAGPLLKEGEAAADLGGIGHGIGGDIDPSVDDAVIDAERGRKGEDAVGEGAQRLIGHFRRQHVEGGHRLGEMHRVVEPEDLVVLGPEPREIRIHGLPALGPRQIPDFRRQRKRALAGRHVRLLPTMVFCRR